LKFKAVIFDLGGTLVRSAAWSDFEDAAAEMASILSVPGDDFVRLYFEHSEKLGTGEFSTYHEYIRFLSSELGITSPDNKVERAAGIPFDISRQMIKDIRPDAVELLSWLKANDYKIGLISDCFTDIPQLWNETPFAPLIDVPIFSCHAGMNKADIRIFQMAVERLDVSPESCVYVADGVRNELANAAKMGMYAVQIYIPEEIDTVPIRENWNGPSILALSEIMEIVG
jgi:putative hydrolase of the HAD superfamily